MSHKNQAASNEVSLLIEKCQADFEKNIQRMTGLCNLFEQAKAHILDCSGQPQRAVLLNQMCHEEATAKLLDMKESPNYGPIFESLLVWWEDVFASFRRDYGFLSSFFFSVQCELEQESIAWHLIDLGQTRSDAYFFGVDPLLSEIREAISKSLAAE